MVVSSFFFKNEKGLVFSFTTSVFAKSVEVCGIFSDFSFFSSVYSFSGVATKSPLNKAS